MYTYIYNINCKMYNRNLSYIVTWCATNANTNGLYDPLKLNDTLESGKYAQIMKYLCYGV